ncbi:hypothetical protein NC652_021277 [Populus alba x Populus x berolinensis]|nr:hypothetical protein NC652_021277 [Populus alba x Populus x berolinensis]
MTGQERRKEMGGLFGFFLSFSLERLGMVP